MPRSTIVIPFHRVDDMLMKAVRSVLNQTVSDFELLLMNDGVPASEVESRLPQDKRIVHVCDGASRGLAARLNESLNYADSEFYFRMDSDDLMVPNRVERQERALSDSPRLSVLGTSAYIIDGSDKVVGVRTSGNLAALPPSAVGPSVFIHPSVACRSNWLREFGYNASFRRTEDKELWIRGYRPGEFGWLREPLLFYRVDGGQSRYVIRQTAKEERRLARLHARENGLLQTGRYLSRSMVAECIKLIIEPTLPGLLNYRRQISIDENEKHQAERVLQAAVDGWDRQR